MDISCNISNSGASSGSTESSLLPNAQGTSSKIYPNVDVMKDNNELEIRKWANTKNSSSESLKSIVNNKKESKHDRDVKSPENLDDGDKSRACNCTGSDSSESKHECSLNGVSKEKRLKGLSVSYEDNSDDYFKNDSKNNYEDDSTYDGDDFDDSEDDKFKYALRKNFTKVFLIRDFSSDNDTDNNSGGQESKKNMNQNSGDDRIDQICEHLVNSKLSGKRKQDSISNELANKKPRIESSESNLSCNSKLEITEEAIRKCLTQKPITFVELLTKLKIKKLKNNQRKQAQNAIISILQEIEPTWKVINDLVYLSL